MKVLFSSGDVGGARALMPVIETCIEKGLPVAVINNGHISQEAPPHWEKILTNRINSRDEVKKFFKEEDIRLLIFTSSLKDSTSLTLARWVKELNVPAFHLLDNWTSYRERMETDGLPSFSPDLYLVMDEMAREGALEEGIEKSNLKVTGHPALATLYKEYRDWTAKNNRKYLKEFGFDSERIIVSFISEPAEQDQGDSDRSPAYRGYTEKVVLPLFCNALQPFSERIQVAILPHPRENIEGLKNLWNKCRGNLQGKLLELSRGREGVFLCNGVAGMASLLLYEAWLLGKAVISLQPGLRQKSLRMLEKKRKYHFC